MGRQDQGPRHLPGPVRSGHGHFVKTSGLRWLSAMVLVPVPWAGRVWALPFLTVLMASERAAAVRGIRHKTLVDGARQTLLQIARWLLGRAIVIVVDSAFSAIDLLAAVRARVNVVTRLRLDARLFAPAPPCEAGTIGQPRRVNQRPKLTPDRRATLALTHMWNGPIGKAFLAI